MNHPLFKNELLSALPVYFRYMTSLQVQEIEEQYNQMVFSSSIAHQCDCLIKHGSYKPISDIDLHKLSYEQQLKKQATVDL